MKIEKKQLHKRKTNSLFEGNGKNVQTETEAPSFDDVSVKKIERNITKKSPVDEKPHDQTQSIKLSPEDIRRSRPIEQSVVRNRKVPRRKKSHKGLIAVIIIIACLVALYVIGIFMWKDKFLPNTHINGQAVGNLSADEAKALLLPQDTDYLIKELDGKEERIPLDSFGYTLTFDKPLTQVISEQNKFTWPFIFLAGKELDNAVSISYDKDQLMQKIDTLDAFNEKIVVAPSDAHLEEDKDGHYSIAPEVMGNKLDHDKSVSGIIDSIDNGNYSIDLTDPDCYLKPAIFSDNKELKEQLDFVKSIGEETITIDLTGAVETLSPLDLKEFVSFDQDDNIIVNEEVLADYVNKLADKYNTYLDQRQFTNHNGQVITVGGNHTDDYGIDTYGFLMNRGATATVLRECIVSKQDQFMTPAWDVPALTRDDVNGDIGNTYIELSLSEQHLWYFVNGNLAFDADVVTGLDTDQRRTPWGLFRAYEKDKDCTLKGEMAGERWNTKVAYWISVTWTGVGIHDASWQPTFGGDWYKTGGSHGCINVTYDTAKYIYDNVAVDTPIVIY